jgi:hypothetical protein
MQERVTVSYHGGLNAGALVILTSPQNDPLADKSAGVRGVEPGGKPHGIMLERGNSGDSVVVELFGWLAYTELAHWNGTEDIQPGTPLFALAELGPDASPLPLRGVCPLGTAQGGDLVGVAAEAVYSTEVALPYRMRALFFAPFLGNVNAGG